MNICAVQDVELEFYFIQILPGKELDLDDELSAFESEQIEAGQKDSPIARYKGLGKYDMLCISEAGLLQKERLRNYCIDFEQVRCFAWEDETGTSALQLVEAAERKYDWTAICFAKVDPSYLNQDRLPPVLVEHAVVNDLRKNLRENGVEVLALGGFGWHEIVLVLWHNDLVDLATTILRLPQFACNGESARAHPLLKTFTIFGLSYDFLRGLSEKRVKTRTWKGLNQKKLHGVDLSIFVTSSALSAAHLQEFLADALTAEVREVYGREDCVIKPKLGQGLGTILESLVRIRRQSASGDIPCAIYSTSTMLELKSRTVAHILSDGEQHEQGERFLERAVTSLLDSGAESVTGSEELPEREVGPTALEVRRLRKQLHLILCSALRDPLMRDAYLDMIFALASFRGLPEYESSERLSATSMKTYLDYVSLGYQERSWGTMSALWNVGNPAPLFYRGGMQRLLWAAESIPFSLLEPSVEWRGFMVFGLTMDYLRGHQGVLSLPHRVMFKPEEWWGLFHEVGHEYVYQVGKRKLGADEWLRRLREIYELTTQGCQSSEQEELHYGHVTWEILSDIFDLEYGFGGEWDPYIRTILKYLLSFVILKDLPTGQSAPSLRPDSPLREKIEFYLVRLVATWCYHKGCESEETIAVDDLIAQVRPLFQRFTADIPSDQRNTPQAVISELETILSADNIFACCERYRLGRLLFSEPGRQLIGEVFASNRPLRDTPCEQFAPLKVGRVLTSVTDPTAVVRYLLRLRQDLKQNDLPARIRIAAVLSLWNMYAKALPERVAKLATLRESDSDLD